MQTPAPRPVPTRRARLINLLAAFTVVLCIALALVIAFTPRQTPPAAPASTLPAALPTRTAPPAPSAVPTAAPTATPPAPAASTAEDYQQKYGGQLSAYREILALTDCAALQARFDLASANNARAAAGTAEFQWTLGYMLSADDRLKQLGCY